MTTNPPLSITIDGPISCMLYDDTRPHCLATATLQKGLVLMFKDQELVEEGMGFGVPVVIFKDEPYFSSTAKCFALNERNCKAFVKLFAIDTVSRKRFGKSAYVNAKLYKLFHKAFHRIYVAGSFPATIFNKFMKLTELFGINTEFVKVKQRGTVRVKYKFNSKSIDVDVDFGRLINKDCEEIVLVNEQGATFFREYTDSEGLALLDGNIEGWKRVNAEEASIVDPQRRLAFSLSRMPGSILFRGREKTRNHYSWVGLSYSLRLQSSVFRYTIKLEG